MVDAPGQLDQAGICWEGTDWAAHWINGKNIKLAWEVDRILERLRNENPAQISLIVTSIPHEVTAGTIALEIFLGQELFLIVVVGKGL